MNLLAVDDGIYFGEENNLYYFGYKNQKKLLISLKKLDSSIVGDLRMIGIIDKKLYFQYLANDQKDKVITRMCEYDFNTKKVKKILSSNTLVNAWIYNQHLLYSTGNIEDVQPAHLYELNVKTHKSKKIETWIKSLAGDYVGNIYYIACGSQDEFDKYKVKLKRYSLITGETEELYEDKYGKIGDIQMAQKDHVYLETLDNTYQTEYEFIKLQQWDSEKNKMKSIAAGTDDKTSYVPDGESNNFYYASYTKNQNGDVTYSRVYQYNGALNSSSLAATFDGQVIGMTSGHVYAIKYGYNFAYSQPIITYGVGIRSVTTYN